MQDTFVLVASNGAIISNNDQLLQFQEFCKTACHQCTVYWQPRNAVNQLIQAVGEEVSFIPHPKTMTMAGEWEYFAAGSQHPFPYAIAELIDNSLRATRGNTTSRRIVVSLVAGTASGGSPKASYISVWDNGCGMSMRQLNEWAVMNLSMEDRGQQPKEVVSARHEQGAAAAKQLHSDMSYFGVGSKNAAFFMGRRIKVTTKSPENVLVHEMEISADSLEERYQISPDQVCSLLLMFASLMQNVQ
jgi:structural maintenance of chromosomes flexible hinge domain-containing protein 1